RSFHSSPIMSAIAQHSLLGIARTDPHELDMLLVLVEDVIDQLLLGVIHDVVALSTLAQVDFHPVVMILTPDDPSANNGSEYLTRDNAVEKWFFFAQVHRELHVARSRFVCLISDMCLDAVRSQFLTDRLQRGYRHVGEKLGCMLIVGETGNPAQAL